MLGIWKNYSDKDSLSIGCESIGRLPYQPPAAAEAGRGGAWKRQQQQQRSLIRGRQHRLPAAATSEASHTSSSRRPKRTSAVAVGGGIGGDQGPARYKFNTATKDYERMSLIESAAATTGGGEGMRQWVDRRLKDSCPMDVIEAPMMLALKCVGKDPAARPEISWVAAKVSKIFLEPRVTAEDEGRRRLDGDLFSEI